MNVATLAELASSPPAPASVNARGSRQSYDTNLTWSPIEGVDDYELVWRLTTSADWEGAQLLEDLEARAAPARRGGGLGRGGAAIVMAATLLGVPIDDMVVGVRAVAADGSRSRVTTPGER